MMKKTFLLLVLLLSISTFSQSINDYQYVIVPTKFSAFQENDKYRLNTITKFLLQKYHFKSFLANDSIPDEIANNNCKRVVADLVVDNSLLKTKVKVVLKDCKENVLFETDFGTSKEKQYSIAYNEALREAFLSFDKLNYKYNGKNELSGDLVAKENPVEEKKSISNATPFYFAQPIANGFQVIDNEPKVIMKLYTTSQSNVYIGVKGTTQGVVVSKNGQWFFDYYENNKLVSEPLNLKF